MNQTSKNRLFTVFRLLLSILVLCLSVLLLLALYNLNVLTTLYYAGAAILVIVIDLIFAVTLNVSAKKRGTQIACSILAIVIACAYGGGAFLLNKTTGVLSGGTSHDGQVRNVVSAYVLDSSSITDGKDLSGKTLGILKGINTVGTQNLLNDLESQGINVKTEEFSNFGPLANALYEKTVDAIVVNDVYVTNITDLEKFQDFQSKTRVVFTTVYYTDVQTLANGVGNLTQEPFTVMLNGSDSRTDLGDTDRSDVNMLVTINPITHVVLMVSLPRDSYVETVCDPEYDCLNGQYDKLTHTGIHTYNTTKATIENLMDVDINYVFRANFNAVVDIIDALGGVDVYVEEGYAVDHFWTNDMFGTDYGVTEGWNHLNGQAALCYARERYAYLEGDFQRIRNQQEVLTQIAQKASSPDVIVHYSSLLDAIDGNFWTDISQSEITNFIQYQIANMPDWTFIQYSLSGTTDSLYCAESYSYASVVVLDQNTVRFAKELIDAVLDGKSADEINEMVDSYVSVSPDYSYLESVNQPSSDYTSDEYYAPVEDSGYYDYTYSDYTYTPPVYQEPVEEYTPEETTPEITVPDTSVPEVSEPSVETPIVPETGEEELIVPEESAVYSQTEEEPSA